MSIHIALDGSLAIITIDRAEKLNALDLHAFREIEKHLDTVSATRGIRGVIFSATGGRAFSAGADITDLVDIEPEEASGRASFRRGVFQKLSELSIPTIAAIDGLALGGGMELALACTFRVATPRSQFAFSEIRLGLIPGAGGTQRLPRLLGKARALELMLTARMIGTEEALEIGLIDRIVDDPIQASRRLADGWLSFSKPALGAILEAVRRSESPILEGLDEEGRLLGSLNASPDGIEGVRAFMERRVPQFNKT